MLQCTSIYRCALFITSKNNINFLFYVHITFFIFYSFFISFFISLSSLSPSLLSSSKPSLHHRSHKPSRQPFSPLPISQAQPLQTILSIADLTSPDADPFLHRRSHKPSRRPFSPSLISQAQPPQTLLSIADLISLAATDPSVSLCTHSVSIKKDQATLLASKSGGQYQLGLDLLVKTTKPCPLAQVSSVGTKTNRVSGMGRGCPSVCVGIEVEISVHWQWLCRVLWYRVYVGIRLRSGLFWCALVVSCFVVSG